MRNDGAPGSRARDLQQDGPLVEVPAREILEAMEARALGQQGLAKFRNAGVGEAIPYGVQLFESSPGR